MKENKTSEKMEGNIHAITAGLLLNGFIQGTKNEKLNDHSLKFAKKELKKQFETYFQKRLKEILPEKRVKRKSEGEWSGFIEELNHKIDGWNDCIDEILNRT